MTADEPLPPNQRMVPACEAVLRANGAPLARGARVLDFGCGFGRHVREFRSAGYRAMGVDQPVPPVADWIEANGQADDLYLANAEGVLPFESDTFDLCYSTTVFEHVMDYGRAVAEISRVLKPDGVSLHLFPARWRPIEAHMYVPLGGRFQSRLWLGIWALVGVRNGFQRGQRWRETVRLNHAFCKTGINYLTGRQILDEFGAHFAQVRFVEAEWVEATRELSRVSRAVAPLVRLAPVGAVYRGAHTRVVLAAVPTRS